MTQLDWIQSMLGILIVVECLKWYQHVTARRQVMAFMFRMPQESEEPDPADWWRQPRDEGDHP